MKTINLDKLLEMGWKIFPPHENDEMILHKMDERIVYNPLTNLIIEEYNVYVGRKKK